MDFWDGGGDDGSLPLTRHFRNLLLNASDVAEGGESDEFKGLMFGIQFHVMLGIAVAIIVLAVVTPITRMIKKEIKGRRWGVL